MRVALYLGFFLLLVPVQVTVLDHISPWGIRPDLCLVATCLMGFLGGKRKGCGIGIGLGYIQDLFSGGTGIVNLLTKGLVGLFSGVVAKTLSNTTAEAIFLPTFFLSCVSGIISMLSARPHTDWVVLLYELRTILLPQSLFDALLAFGVYWMIGKLRIVSPLAEPSSFR